jgi:hypothetical protein
MEMVSRDQYMGLFEVSDKILGHTPLEKEIPQAVQNLAHMQHLQRKFSTPQSQFLTVKDIHNCSAYVI